MNTAPNSAAYKSTEAHCRRVLAAADFMADYRASHPELLRVPSPPSDLLNQLELDALAASFGR